MAAMRRAGVGVRVALAMGGTPDMAARSASVRSLLAGDEALAAEHGSPPREDEPEEDDSALDIAPPRESIEPLDGSGLSFGVRDSILMLDRHELVFALGKFAVVQNMQSQELVVIGGQQCDPPALEAIASGHRKGKSAVHTPAAAADHHVYVGAELGAITALALCTKRSLLAICRSATDGVDGSSRDPRATQRLATISIHNLKGTRSSRMVGDQSRARVRGSRLKVLSFPAERFTSTALSTDGTLVCCQSSTASWSLVVWDWSRERQVALVDVHYKVSRVRFNLVDMGQISTSGGNQLKLWTLSEYSLKNFASFKSGDETRTKHVASYVDHVWLPDDCLVALLDDGSVQLIINGELLQTVVALPIAQRALCLASLNNGDGAIIGGERGCLALLRLATKMMRSGEKEIHVQRQLRVADAQKIMDFAVDPSGTTLVCCTERLYGSYDLSNLCLLMGDEEVITLASLTSTPFSSAPQHLSAASRRPCFAATSVLPDESAVINVWSQNDAHECFVAYPLESGIQPLSMDLHPHGTEMIVSSASRVVIYSVLQEALKPAFELLHDSGISGILFSPAHDVLMTCSVNGIVLASRIIRDRDGKVDERAGLDRFVLTPFDDIRSEDPSKSFVSVCSVDEVALYDRSSVENRRLKVMDLEGEIQQLKMENEMINKHLAEQRKRFEDRMKEEVIQLSNRAEGQQQAIKHELQSQIDTLEADRERRIAALSADAQLARDQYRVSLEKTQHECQRLQTLLTTTEHRLEDTILSHEERISEIKKGYEARLLTVAETHREQTARLQGELESTRLKLEEVLRQQDQDQLAQLSLLSTAIDAERRRAGEEASHNLGRMAALNQEVKMLLTALSQKDHEMMLLQQKYQQSTADVAALKELVRRERDAVEKAVSEKNDLVATSQEQRTIMERLQRLNLVHRSQIELLQKHLLPKDREIDDMQQHLRHLHQANQEIVVQANLSDRLRAESAVKVKQHEQEIDTVRRRLDDVRNLIVVLQTELGEIIKQSAIQDKSVLVGELSRVHKRLTRQLDLLESRDGRSEEISVELHRQNKFLLKNKQHLRRQMDLVYREKHKLASALSYQNTTLINELNEQRKLSKELERKLEQCQRLLRAKRESDPMDHGGQPNEIDGRDVLTTQGNEEVEPLVALPAPTRRTVATRRPQSATLVPRSVRNRPSSALR
ncbi:hypothetical protein ATCC90586_004642 [Pythium insidiosum]|nr:hypothetical protein ATCC90586_004642 [Pythium insidiosum]